MTRISHYATKVLHLNTSRPGSVKIKSRNSTRVGIRWIRFLGQNRSPHRPELISEIFSRLVSRPSEFARGSRETFCKDIKRETHTHTHTHHGRLRVLVSRAGHAGPHVHLPVSEATGGNMCRGSCVTRGTHRAARKMRERTRLSNRL